MKNNKKQLHEALAVLLTKLSSARDNPLLIDNYVVNALRTTLVTFKESGELHEALKEQIQTEIAEYKCSIPIIYFNGHLTVLNSVDFLGDYIYTKSITFGPEGKVYNAILYKSMIYPLGLNLKKHVVPGKNGTDWSNWKLFVEGQVIYDPNIKKMKLFNGEAWVNLDGTELA